MTARAQVDACARQLDELTRSVTATEFFDVTMPFRCAMNAGVIPDNSNSAAEARPVLKRGAALSDRLPEVSTL